MAKIIVGDRVGRSGRLGVGCSASVFDSLHKKVLLIRRADNGKWAVPGGYMQAGEGFSEACAREVFEETGLLVIVHRLIGIYTSPHRLLEYPDGNKWQLVVLHFEAEIAGGELRTSDESTNANYFSVEEISDLDISVLDRQRVLDGFARRVQAFVRDDFAKVELV